MRNERKIIVFATVVVIVFLVANFGVAAGPTIGEITLSPPKPTPQSTVTFSVNISDDSPSEVWLIVKECNATLGVCYPEIQNVSMGKFETGRYETNISLKYDGATYITYWVSAKKNDGSWTDSPKTDLDLSEKPSGGDHSGNGNNRKTPGFELVLFVVAVGLGVLLLGRKRLR